MNKKAQLLKTLLNIVLIGAIIFLAFLVYQNLPGPLENFKTNLQGLPNVNSTEATATLTQFLPNMRFNHSDITYNFESACSSDRMQRMESAMEDLSQRTKIITFRASINPDIKIYCSKEKPKDQNSYVAGEGGPEGVVNLSLYPLIGGGKITLYDDLYQKKCENNIVEMHELLHVFGYNHVQNKSSLLYPYFNCNQKMTEDIITDLVRLYSVTPKAELYFDKLIATKSGVYLNFETNIPNQGLIEGKNVKLIISSGNAKIEEIPFGEITSGTTQTAKLTNLKLPSRSITSIKFEITSDTAEFDKTNNVAQVNI